MNFTRRPWLESLKWKQPKWNYIRGYASHMKTLLNQDNGNLTISSYSIHCTKMWTDAMYTNTCKEISYNICTTICKYWQICQSEWCVKSCVVLEIQP